MQQHVLSDKQGVGQQAAAVGIARIRHAIDRAGHASIIVATGASQFETLTHLAQAQDVRWDRVTIFHLDEYVGISIVHPASFRKCLWERFHSRLPLPVRAFHYIDAEGDAEAERRRLSDLIRGHNIDLAFVGIGENAHLAFNDPPADFDTDEPYLIVQLDEVCRRQQLGEGWFQSIEEVPTQAISMSVRQIMKSVSLIVSVSDTRKASAVAKSVAGSVTNQVPASILQNHGDCTVFMDQPAASLLKTGA